LSENKSIGDLFHDQVNYGMIAVSISDSFLSLSRSTSEWLVYDVVTMALFVYHSGLLHIY
jgi:hypothetical protein